MRAIVQRVHWAEVEVDGELIWRIERGLLVYVGIAVDDEEGDAERLAEKVSHMRIFEDENGKLNLAVRDARGGILAVPNFTLMADADKGRRPAFTAAAKPEHARRLFETFLTELKERGHRVGSGVFGTRMAIRSSADGPVNIILQ